MAVDVDLLNSNGINNIESNFERVQTALQDAVSRSGNTPNHMNADFDMNGNDLLNVGTLQVNNITIDGDDPTSLLERALEAVEEAEAAADASEASAVDSANSADEAAALVASVEGSLDSIAEKVSFTESLVEDYTVDQERLAYHNTNLSDKYRADREFVTSFPLQNVQTGPDLATTLFISADYSPTQDRVFIAGVDGTHNLAYSDDGGISWTAVDVSPFIPQAVKWIPGRNIWMVCGDNTTQGVMTSPTGEEGTWTLRTTPTGNWHKLAYSQEFDRVVMIGNAIGGYLAYSNDGGVTWTSVVDPSPIVGGGRWLGVGYSDKQQQFVIVGGDSSDVVYGNYILRGDGTSYTAVSVPFDMHMWAIKFIPEWDIWLAIANFGEGRAMWSPDASEGSWTQFNTPEEAGGQNFDYSPELDMVLVVGNDANTTSEVKTFWCTRDLVFHEWVPETGSASDHNQRDVVWVGGHKRFVICTTSSAYGTSTNQRVLTTMSLDSKYVSPGFFYIEDDGVLNIPIPSVIWGALINVKIVGNHTLAASPSFCVVCSSNLAPALAWSTNSADIDLLTPQTLTGTTGTDTNYSLALTTDSSALQIENRTGSRKAVFYSYAAG